MIQLKKFGHKFSCLAILLSLQSCGFLGEESTQENSADTTTSDKATSEKNTMEKTNLLSALSFPAPQAERQQHINNWHGYSLEDPYHWIRDEGYPVIDDEPVLEYLNKENDYFDSFMAPHEKFVDTLFEEMKGRLDESEESVPFVNNGYEYRWYFKEGADYRTRVRKKIGEDTEEVVLDEQEMAAGFDYHVLGTWEVSPDNKLVAYTVDTDGDERYTIKVKDLTTQKVLDVAIQDSDGGLEFSSDGKKIIYGRLNKERWRTDDVVAYSLETSEETVLFNEPDHEFFISYYSTMDNSHLIITINKGGITETRAIPLDDVLSEAKLFASRDEGFRYQVGHAHGKFYILANDSHVNFRLATVNNADPSYANWKTVIEGSDDTYLEGVLTFNDFMILSQSKEAYQQIIVMDYDNNQHEIAFPEKMISVRPTGNYDFNQSHVRLNYESFLTPDTVFDYDTKSEELVTRKEKKIPSGYNKSKYETKRLMITTRDGVKVPVSLMYLKGTEFDGTNPMHMTGYGAYSIGYSTTFSTNRLSIVDRGVTYAIAHIRGGDDMGYQWYLDGKFKKRQNTFNDFVDVAKALIDDGYTAKRNLSISGRSAGGKLMGAVVVQAPELWSSVTLGVPFVDVINTIMDASLPLTPPEWEEWGNPIKSKEYFDYIMSYSPYDNIEARDYPPMMVTGGLNDPRVTYWEPAKWTAKMRHLKTDNNLLVMRMNMGAGHFANSGRYGRLKDYAQEYAFMLLSHGVSE